MNDLFCAPDLSARPFQMSITCPLDVAPAMVFDAWTKHLDRWLAAPGTVLMTPRVNTVFYFETHHEAEQGLTRQPYYGRFLRLIPNQLIEMTWLSTGTNHTETVITIKLTPNGSGTDVQLAQAGFPIAELMQAHKATWPTFLQQITPLFGDETNHE